MEVTNTVTVTKHYEKCLNMLLHVVLLYFGGHMIRANRIYLIEETLILESTNHERCDPNVYWEIGKN